jgi:perosamine synthetase
VAESGGRAAVPGTEERIPLARPLLGEREEELVLEVLRSGMLSLGPMLGRFERDFAAYVGSDDAVAVSSGTAALHLGVRERGWGPGDRVITSPLSFIASSNCLLFEGAEPLFCDVDPVTLCLDPGIAATEADGEGVSGILPIHIFGHTAPMDELEALARSRGIGLLEDAAQALGTVTADGRQAGARGNPAAFAFYANKQMTTGEGGMLVPAGPEAAEAARSERNQGRAPGSRMKVMTHDRLGFNYRLTDVAAAIGVAQLERLDEMLAARAAVADAYTERLTAIGAVDPADGELGELLLPTADAGEARRSWFVYIVRVPTGTDRDAVIDELEREGIDARPYIPCIHLHEFFRERFGFAGGEFPVAEEFSSRAIALPFYATLGEEQVERVVGSLRKALGR